MNKAILILVALLVLQASAQTHDFVFAFSWLGGFCKSKTSNSCIPEKYNLWDHQSFTIHGLWSQDRNSPRIFGDFDVDLISADRQLADNMMNYMPPRTKPSQTDNFFLWDHEWAGSNDAHGHDYGNVVLQVFPEKYKGLSEEERNVKVQQDFFHEIVKFYESYSGSRKITKAKHTRAELAALFGVNPSWLQLSCQSNTYVTELRVCATLSKTGFAPTSCSSAGNCNSATLELWDWKKTSQVRVVNPDAELETALGFQRIETNEADADVDGDAKKAEADTDDSSSESSSDEL